METVATITQNMTQAIGTTQYIKHFTGLLVFTDGVNQLRQDADAFWLVDAIASYQIEHKDKEFQIWELAVDTEKKTAVLTMKEDSDKPKLVKKEIAFTDFPLSNVKIYVQLGSIDGVNPVLVLMLTSEY